MGKHTHTHTHFPPTPSLNSLPLLQYPNPLNKPILTSLLRPLIFVCPNKVVEEKRRKKQELNGARVPLSSSLSLSPSVALFLPLDRPSLLDISRGLKWMRKAWRERMREWREKRCKRVAVNHLCFRERKREEGERGGRI